MCGIFGFVATQGAAYNPRQLEKLTTHFLHLAEARGKDASGVSLISPNEITVLKRPIRARHLVHAQAYKDFWRENQEKMRDLGQEDAKHLTIPLAVVGHARMVTNGSEETHENNQPVIKDGLICMHNGIIVNDRQLWEKYAHLARSYEVDTEVFLALIRNFQAGRASWIQAVIKGLEQIDGANSFALLSEDHDGIVIATTNGSMYFIVSEDKKTLVFASEKYFLEKIIQQNSLRRIFPNNEITQVLPGNGYSFSFFDLSPAEFQLHAKNELSDLPGRNEKREVVDKKDKETSGVVDKNITKQQLLSYEKMLEIDEEKIQAQTRCTRCLLPESFPYIVYDEQGVCNYCHNYQPYEVKGEDSLAKILRTVPHGNGTPNILMPLSGGRDSSYAVHYVKRELGLHPVAYTYDWGMVTDLARRNISRICGQLGIEHILISADIRKKRENVRKNVLAWLKKPDLGTVPLFMAGDKQFFYYAQMLKRQMKLATILFAFNPLERTDFKSAFAGINENKPKDVHYILSTSSKIGLAFYYMKQFMSNPAYINSSLLDTLFAYFSYYILPHDYYTIYDFIRWDEEKIAPLLISEYDWETSTDTNTTWRIGDGTASFYNYIYYRLAGFTENDTMRSNLIREGVLEREEGLRLIQEENKPRLDSILWYCDTIGFDFEYAFKAINAAPTRY